MSLFLPNIVVYEQVLTLLLFCLSWNDFHNVYTVLIRNHSSKNTFSFKELKVSLLRIRDLFFSFYFVEM